MFNIISISHQDRVRVMINDLKCLVSTFAREDSFSKFSHGGGPEHNMNLVPFFIHGAFMVWLEDPEY